MNNKPSMPLGINIAALKSTKASSAYSGGDFAHWQTLARSKLCELLGMDKLKPVPACTAIEYKKETEWYTDIRFTFFSEEGYSVPCHLCIPLSANEPLPLVVCLQGHSPGMYVSLGETRKENDFTLFEGDRDFALRAVKEGCCALAIEQRCFGECGSDENSRPDCYLSSMTALMCGRTLIGERVWDIMRAIDAVRDSFSEYADISRLVCLGNSGGGTAAFYASCLDERIKISVPSCSLCTFEESIGAMHHCACNYVPHIMEHFNMGDLCGLIAPRHLVMVSGEKDGIFPIEGAKKTFKTAKELYTSAGCADNCVMTVGGEGHRFYADIAWEQIHKYLKGII